jgi:hypothetical protein
MKMASHPKLPRRIRSTGQSGMTLVEVMIASTLMLLVVAGLMAAHLVGMREDQLMESKAGASDSSRYAINQMMQDIRAAKGYDIGSSWDGSIFTAITNGYYQGPDLRIYTSVNSSNQNISLSQYTIYYFDASQAAAGNGVLWRSYNSNGVQVATVVASNLINTLWFTSEDYAGSTQQSKTYKGVIHTTLQFTKFLYPITSVGSNCLYNYYRIDCRVTPHLPDGP